MMRLADLTLRLVDEYYKLLVLIKCFTVDTGG